MCDQTTPIIKNTWVWAKLFNRYWWPGKVVDKYTIPENLKNDKKYKYKKHPIMSVYFESDKSFEDIFNLNKVYPYSCAKKNEFLKKGYLLYVKQQKGRKSAHFDMKKFIDDVINIERNIRGDVNIFEQFKEEIKNVKIDIKKLFVTEKERKKMERKERLFSLSCRTRSEKPKLTTNASSGQNITQKPVEPPIYNCVYCSSSFSRYSMFQWHIKDHKKNNTSLQVLDKFETQENDSVSKTSVSNTTGSDDVFVSETTGLHNETHNSTDNVKKEFQTSTQNDVHNANKTINNEDKQQNCVKSKNIETEIAKCRRYIESSSNCLSDLNSIKSNLLKLGLSEGISSVDYDKNLRTEPYPINIKEDDELMFPTSYVKEKPNHGDIVKINLPRIPQINGNTSG